MKNAYTVIFVIALILAVVWFGPSLLAERSAKAPASRPSPTSTVHTPTVTPEPEPSPEPSPDITTESDPTPKIRPRFQFCVDGTPMTVTSADANQTNYKCGSGARGAYLNGEAK